MDTVLLARLGVVATLMLSSIPALHAETGSDLPIHIKTLASSCAACHGTNGNSVTGTPVLAGLEQSHFILQMNAFRSGERSSTVMHRHAKGLTSDEITQLASYFAIQKRVESPKLSSQTLEAGHDN